MWWRRHESLRHGLCFQAEFGGFEGVGLSLGAFSPVQTVTQQIAVERQPDFPRTRDAMLRLSVDQK